MIILKSFLLLFGLFNGITVFGQTVENNRSTEPLDPEIYFGQLDNGFRYYIKPVDTENSKVLMSLYIKVGHSHEGKDKRDVAHFLEHMAALHTKNFTHLYSNTKLLNSIGMDMIDVRANTGIEYTQYQFNFPVDADSKKALETGLSWFHGIVGREVEFQKDDVDVQRKAIYEEIVGRHYKDNYIQSKMFNAIYGSGADLIKPENYEHYFQNLDIKKIIRFYKDWYRPDLASLVVVGNIKDVEAMEHQIRKMFSKLQVNPDSRPHEDWHLNYLRRPCQFVVLENDVEAFGGLSNDEVGIYTLIRNSKYQERGTWAGVKRGLIKELLKNVVRIRFDYYQKYTHQTSYKLHYNYSRSGNLIRVIAGEGKERKGLQQAFGILKDIKSNGITKEEWDKIRKDKLQGMQNIEDNPHYWKKAIWSYDVYGEALPVNKNQRLQKWLENLSLDELHTWFLEVLSEMPDDIGIIAAKGNKALSYTEKKVRHWIEEAAPIANIYKPTAPESLMSKEEVSRLPDVVYTKRENPELRVKELKFENGVKVVLQNVDSTPDKVLVHGFSPKGISCFSKDEYCSAVFAPTIFNYSGVGRWNKFELEQFFAETSFPYGIEHYIDYATSGIKGEATLSDLEDLLQLIYLYFTAPRKDTKTFTRWKNEEKEMYLHRQSGVLNFDMKDKLITSIAKDSTIVTPGGTRRFKSSKGIGLDEAYQAYKNIYGNARNFTFLISGKYPEEKIIYLLTKYLGNLPGDDKSIDCLPPVLPREIHKVSLYKEMTPEEGLDNAKIRWWYVWPMDTSYNWQEDIKLDFLGRVIMREVQNIRDVKKRGVYIAYAGKQNMSSLQWSTISINVDCTTEEWGLVLGDMEEIERELKEKKLTTDMFNIVARWLIEKYQAAIANDNVQEKSKKLYQYYRHGENIVTIEEVLNYIQSLTREDILKTAKKYLKEQYRSEYIAKSKMVDTP
ncbi:insulinase family protein [Sinomicrobium kalidii]|uniref:M16 family metallopeptidase n=1 Tax=Sinomicrobium kalidii TaxID=2900738 RepID=UPI001E47E52B|nr:insulinase family protein [Sinomicrobium kalidii]UGU15737.1 insulinase family protein [Sinomicrobium kalidii]